MIAFEYARASNIADAVSLMAASPGAKFIAGGTNLVDLMKMHVERPAKLIDVSKLPLDKVEETAAGGLRIGALRAQRDLAYHPLVERYPMLSSAIMAGASQQLRNMASVGNLLQPRAPLPGSGDGVQQTRGRVAAAQPTGHNRMHAILGTSDACIAVHPSDMCVGLAVLEATVHAAGHAGRSRDRARGLSQAPRRHAAARDQPRKQ